MFTYLHCYKPEYWDAMVEHGLVNDNAGVRFMQSITLEEKEKFNNLAAKGTKLYNLLNERKCPFYIDRLQGGCYIENYSYDMDLVNDYRRMLGDNFWGFQLHEWMSNPLADRHKIYDSDWTEEGIIKMVQEKFPYPFLFLEALNADEFAKFGKFDTIEKYLKVVDYLIKTRQASVQGDCLAVDSGYLAMPIEFQNGVKRFMPEIGAQTGSTRIQLSYARGMSKATGIPFGGYYEPWGGDPFSTCLYNKENYNEWNINKSNFPFVSEGPNGGSSRSLQKRVHYFAYVSGAQFMSEEWGLGNTFNSMKDLDLSPYGIVKRDFIKFTEKYPNIGELITPVGVVISEKIPALDVFDIYSEEDEYFGLKTEGEFKKIVHTMCTGLKELFSKAHPPIGMETSVLINGVIPEAMDIVNEQYLDASKYEYLVNLTNCNKLNEKYGQKVIDIGDVPTVLDKLLPCKVEGNVLPLVTENDKGEHYLLLLNNNGVTRSVAMGERIDHNADAVVTVTIKDSKQLTMLEGDSTIEKVGNQYKIKVTAGDLFFGKF